MRPSNNNLCYVLGFSFNLAFVREQALKSPRHAAARKRSTEVKGSRDQRKKDREGGRERERERGRGRGREREGERGRGRGRERERFLSFQGKKSAESRRNNAARLNDCKS